MLPSVSVRWQIFKTVAGIVLLIVAAWLGLGLLLPAPPTAVGMATGFVGGSYEHFGARYRDQLARQHVKLQLRSTEGSGDNLRLLQTPGSGVPMAFVQGGVSNAERAPGLVSLGRVNRQVFWIFYRGNDTLTRLTQLKGKRIAVGTAGSGTQVVAKQILGASGVNAASATLLPLAGQDAVRALRGGQLDVAFLAFAADAPIVQDLLRDPSVHLMSVAQADALTRIFPFLDKLVLPQGVIDLDQNIPASDVVLLGTTNAVLVRDDLHPETIQLMARTLAEVHGGAGLFQRAGEFPTQADPEYPMSMAARDYYRNGPSFLHRYLPLWFTNYAQRIAALLAAAAALFFPIFSYAPRLYRWYVRERLNRLYHQLREVETAMVAELLPAERIATLQRQLDAIERGMHPLGVPIRHSDLFFALKNDIQLVRTGLQERLARSGEERRRAA